MTIKYMLKERFIYKNLYDEKKIHNTQTVGCGKDIGVGDLPTPYFFIILHLYYNRLSVHASDYIEYNRILHCISDLINPAYRIYITVLFFF